MFASPLGCLTIGPHVDLPLAGALAPLLAQAAAAVAPAPPAGSALGLSIATLALLVALLLIARTRRGGGAGAPRAGEEALERARRDAEERGRRLVRLEEIERQAAIGSLAARVVHDVRNPLFALSATLDAFEARVGAQADTARYVAALREQAGRMERLMKDLGGSAAPQAPSIEPVAPFALAEEALRASAPSGAAAGVEIRNRIEESLEPVAADREQMVVALRHLIANAVRRSPPGSPVEIAARREGRNGRSVLELEVRDAGPPIPEPEMRRLFDPLFVPSTGEPGLGLAVARRIVEGHRGEVSLRNRDGGGAVAVLRLPCPPG